MGIREEVLSLLDSRPDIDQHILGAHTRLSASAFRHIMSGQKDPGQNAVRELQRVLRLVEQGDILQPGQEAVEITERDVTEVRKLKRSRDFYKIETVSRVGQVLNYCADQGLIGVVSGNYGIGKSDAVQHWRNTSGRTIPHIFIEFDEFCSRNVIDFINQIAEQLDLPTFPGHSTGGKTFRAVCEALSDQPMLLIFDQCESVQARIFQVIRQIWDRTRRDGVGIVLLGSPLLVERMRDGRMRDVGALTSRVGIWAALNGVQKAEVARIVRDEGVTKIDDEALHLLWHATGGSMRRLMAVTDLLVTKHGGKAVTTRTIEGVASSLWGMDLSIGRAA